MYGDSVQLAKAYGSLKRRSFLNFRLTSPFAHACYHYGRLLRAQDDPVSAMQVFIDATHSRTRDYHILGRVYSNMGDIAHLAGEVPLAYEMYKLSGDNYLHGGDTLLYYYDLNNMAFEKAMLTEKDESLDLLNSITQNYSDSYLLLKTWETKAVVYKRVAQYDSAMYCANQLAQSDDLEPSMILIIAQAYDDLGQKDSALLYAQKIMTHDFANYQDKFNALYIVRHCDSTLCIEDVDSLYSQREDIRYYEYEPQRKKLLQAVQLLEQDLNRQTDLWWLYSIIITLFLVGTVLGIYVFRKRKKHQLLAQKVDELATSYSDMQSKRITQIEQNCAIIRASKNLSQELCWKDYEQMCSIVDKHFYFLSTKLTQKQLLNETEIRLCILVLLDMSRAQIADTLPYSLNSVGKLKDQTAKKLGTTGKNLRNFLENMAIEG